MFPNIQNTSRYLITKYIHNFFLILIFISNIFHLILKRIKYSSRN